MSGHTNSDRAPRNRTIALSPEEIISHRSRLVKLKGQCTSDGLENKTIHQDLFEVLDWLPAEFADLIFLDPPYNLTKQFNGTVFREKPLQEYADWLEGWFPRVVKILKSTGSMYICADWRSSSAVYLVAQKYLKIQNRITWEREKGRGASKNWKNCHEDIWFCTRLDDYKFNVESVKLKRRVIAPYTCDNGTPKDWDRTEGGDYRLTHPSNLWTDLTIPFWSMPENTAHPTQKPEKLLAKIILASSLARDVVFDPFLGSGTTSVVAKKLGRKYLGIEVDEVYCCLAEKRLEMADKDSSIQGYTEGVFWERNSFPNQRNAGSRSSSECLAFAFDDSSQSR
jgi:site-specific DNA-methyltransferase (adenine-specific)